MQGEPRVLVEETLTDLEGQRRFGYVLYYLHQGMYPDEHRHWKGAAHVFDCLRTSDESDAERGVYWLKLPWPFSGQVSLLGEPMDPSALYTGVLKVTLSNPAWRPAPPRHNVHIEWWKGEGKCRIRAELLHVVLHTPPRPPKRSLWQRASDWFEEATDTGLRCTRAF